MSDLVTRRRIVRHRGDASETVDDDLVVEAPLEIRLGDEAIAVVMRTPGHDEELIRGFALTEGIAIEPGEIQSVEDLSDGRYALRLSVPVDPARFRRNLYATSSCGVCGKASIDAVRVAARAPRRGPVIPASVFEGLPDALRAAQPTFDLTGGLHGAGAFTEDGTLVAVREDVGRHNAVDKLVGHIGRDDWPVPHPILFVSGRVSFEIMQKAAVAGFPIIAGVSAVSSLAVDLAEELGMTVLGFVRGGGLNVYSGSDRIAA